MPQCNGSLTPYTKIISKGCNLRAIMNQQQSYYGSIDDLLRGLRTVAPLSEHFHLHRFSDTPASWLAESSIFRSDTYALILLL